MNIAIFLSSKFQYYFRDIDQYIAIYEYIDQYIGQSGVNISAILEYINNILINISNNIAGPGGWPRTVGHDLKFESPGGNDAGSSFSASRRDATRRMSATELVCASPSQQRLRRSSVAAALRAP